METTPSTSLNVLGPVAIASAGETIVAEHRPRLLFVLLAEQLGDVVPSWQLVDAVWGRLAEPPSTAESALRNYLQVQFSRW